MTHDYTVCLQTIAGKHNGDGNQGTLFHGGPVSPQCTLLSDREFCSDVKCFVCNISRNGFDSNRIGKGALSCAMQQKGGAGFKRYGFGFYFANNSSKSYDYSTNHGQFPGVQYQGHKCHAMLICKLAQGRVQKLMKDDEQRTAPDPGYDSVVGESAAHGGVLNYPEAVVYDTNACLASYAILFREK